MVMGEVGGGVEQGGGGVEGVERGGGGDVGCGGGGGEADKRWRAGAGG